MTVNGTFALPPRVTKEEEDSTRTYVLNWKSVGFLTSLPSRITLFDRGTMALQGSGVASSTYHMFLSNMIYVYSGNS
jgi:hypothetical protein